MSSSNVPPSRQTPSDDDFGTGLFEEPAPKKAASAAAPPAVAKAPPAAAPAPKPADEDDGFGAGLV
jgi:hypothetical protein